jgi:hypothetical protein
MIFRVQICNCTHFLSMVFYFQNIFIVYHVTFHLLFYNVLYCLKINLRWLSKIECIWVLLSLDSLNGIINLILFETLNSVRLILKRLPHLYMCIFIHCSFIIIITTVLSYIIRAVHFLQVIHVISILHAYNPLLQHFYLCTYNRMKIICISWV